MLFFLDVFRARQRVLLQCLDIVTYFVKFAGYPDVLRTVGLTLATADTVVGLPQLGYGAVEADEILTAQSPVLLVAFVEWESAFVLAFVVMYEDGGNIDSVGARHTVFAVVARDVLKTYYPLCHLFVKIALLAVGKRSERTV